ncbi:MAG TPA: OmpA family protein [Planctomycetota bacterium]|nr:OmpA family protein [Planctomycetota bacterium]
MRLVAPLSRLVLTSAVLALGAGCVEKARYDALETRYKEREATIQQQDSQIAEARSRAEIAAAQSVATEKEISLLKAKLEAKEVAASLAAPAAGPEDGAGAHAGPAAGRVVATTALASAPQGGESVTPGGDGWNINPATGGIVLDAGVLFQPGGGALRTQAAPVLDRLVAAVNAPGLDDALVRVEGHTDDTPINRSKNKDNWELAGKRALAVLNYLEDHGVKSERLSFAGFGATRPIDGATTPDARAKNRRVEVVLVRRK